MDTTAKTAEQDALERTCDDLYDATIAACAKALGDRDPDQVFGMELVGDVAEKLAGCDTIYQWVTSWLDDRRAEYAASWAPYRDILVGAGLQERGTLEPSTGSCWIGDAVEVNMEGGYISFDVDGQTTSVVISTALPRQIVRSVLHSTLHTVTGYIRADLQERTDG